MIDTHWHVDHTDNNANLHAAGATVLAHDNTKTRMAEPHDSALMGLHFPASPADALPQQTFSSSKELHANGEIVMLQYFQPAHTDTDIYIHFQKANVITLRDEIRQPDRQPLRLTIPREERLARVADALLDDVGDDRTLDDWAHLAGMARRTFMRAFSAQAGLSFGRWRQQARLFAALEMLAQSKSVTEVAIAVGYDSVSAFIEMFRTMLGTTPQRYFRGRRS